MKDICALCGKELNGYYAVEFNNEQYKVCESCNSKLKNGKVSFDNLSSDVAPNITEAIKKEDERAERKITAQKNDPLYDDIHQIAGDLRFLKNLVVIGLIISIVSGILSVLTF